MDSIDSKSRPIFKEKFKKSISDFLDFIKLAERINNNEFLICDKKFYNDQADYIENLYSIKLVQQSQSL
jgi:hypothetical protein